MSGSFDDAITANAKLIAAGTGCKLSGAVKAKYSFAGCSIGRKIALTISQSWRTSLITADQRRTSEKVPSAAS